MSRVWDRKRAREDQSQSDSKKEFLLKRRSL
jgi:hypothetical protein